MLADSATDPFVFLNDAANKDVFPQSIRKAITAQKLVNAVSPHPKHYGRTLLHLAVWSNNIPAAEFLLDQGADVNKLDDLHDSPFLLTGAEGRPEILDMILTNAMRVQKFGSDSSRRKKTSVPDFSVLNRFGGSALIPACERGHLECARLLMEKSDIDVNHMNFYTLTGLLEVVVLGGDDVDHVEIVKLLLAHGVDLDTVDANGKTALQTAREKGLKRITALLEAAGAR